MIILWKQNPVRTLFFSFFLFLTQGVTEWWSRESPLCVSDKPGTTAAPSQTSRVTLNCVMFIDESAQCCWDRGGALSRAERWNAPIEENTDGQPRSAARRPVPRHGMPNQGTPRRKCNAGREGKGRRVSQIILSWCFEEKCQVRFRRKCARLLNSLLFVTRVAVTVLSGKQTAARKGARSELMLPNWFCAQTTQRVLKPEFVVGSTFVTCCTYMSRTIPINSFLFTGHSTFLKWMSAINRHFPKSKEGNENNE